MLVGNANSCVNPWIYIVFNYKQVYNLCRHRSNRNPIHTARRNALVPLISNKQTMMGSSTSTRNTTAISSYSDHERKLSIAIEKEKKNLMRNHFYYYGRDNRQIISASIV